MKNKDESQFFFTPEDENSPSEFEDISSSSHSEAEIEDVYSISDFAGNGKYFKKKRGFFGKISNWWYKRKKGEKAAVITLTAIALIFAVILGVIANTFDYNYNKIDTDDLGFENVIDGNIINIALFGIDTRDTKSFQGNSDSIMILSLNTVTKQVKIISVMRDSLVPITYNGKTTYTKINSAYARGGPELAIKTLNKIFGLDISDYATVNFFGMVDIIDALGGIEAELTEAEVQPKSQFRFGINGCISEICNQMGKSTKGQYVTEPGKHLLNGVQAVAYSRIRKVANIWGTNNDYGRTDRQRYVMEQLFNKAVKLEKKSYIKLAKSLIPCSQTSLTYNEILGLAFDILLKSPTFHQTRVPQEDYLMTSPNTPAGSVVYYDLDFAAKIIHAFIYDDTAPESFIETNGIERNDWYRDKVGYYTNSGTTSSQGSTPQTSSESHGNGGNTSSEEPVDSGNDEPTVPDGPDTSGDPDNPGNTDTPSNPDNPGNSDSSGSSDSSGGSDNTPSEPSAPTGAGQDNNVAPTVYSRSFTG